ncbi:unnamed protein product [Prorocentrum cordatum]|uniref:Uncharacterized protein n=1 Tax=Prorocentrum cordatum TaxID=2364126 RepID=A0ABN9RAJ5_9DINO|nr:unnamed protein product [Polarella glacialis]
MAPAAPEGLLAVEEREGRGRGLVARRAIAAGARVLAEEPWACCLADAERGRRCDWSLAAPTGGKKQLRCAATGLAFASQREQRAAWAEYYAGEHRAASAASSRGLPPRALPPVVRLALRVLRRWLGEQEGAQPPWARLESHWHHLQPAQRATLEERAGLCAEELRRGAGAAQKAACEGLGVAAIAELLAALSVNAVVVADEEQRSLGLGLYLRAALLNHSEEPSCAQSFVGRMLEVLTTRGARAAAHRRRRGGDDHVRGVGRGRGWAKSRQTQPRRRPSTPYGLTSVWAYSTVQGEAECRRGQPRRRASTTCGLTPYGLGILPGETASCPYGVSTDGDRAQRVDSLRVGP